MSRHRHTRQLLSHQRHLQTLPQQQKEGYHPHHHHHHNHHRQQTQTQIQAEVHPQINLRLHSPLLHKHKHSNDRLRDHGGDPQHATLDPTLATTPSTPTSQQPPSSSQDLLQITLLSNINNNQFRQRVCIITATGHYITY